MEGRAKGDAQQSKRIRALAGHLRDEHAVLNVAVCAEALEERRRVPLEQVWPDSVDALREGIEMGAYETILHGLLHLNPEALERGEVEYTEFARLDAATAGEHLDRALDWQSRKLTRPTVFVAPAWAYGPAADAEGAERGLVRWYRARPGPLLDKGRFYETLIGELLGLYKLDYSPLVRLAALGIPPVIAMHGALLDGRLASLKANREVVLLARAAGQAGCSSPGRAGRHPLGRGGRADRGAGRTHRDGPPRAGRLGTGGLPRAGRVHLGEVAPQLLGRLTPLAAPQHPVFGGAELPPHLRPHPQR